MNVNKLKWVLPLFMLLFIFLSVPIVKADDDDKDDHDHEKYEKYREWEDDEDDWDKGREYDSNSNNSYNNHLQTSFWNIWTREITGNVSNVSLPFQDAKEININFNNQVQPFFIIPRNGQLLVSGKKIAEIFQAEWQFHEQSKILEISKGNEELIVRAGSNAAYENMMKTPMPGTAIYYDRTIYLPISVLANSFGYGVSWDAAQETINLQEMR